MNRDLEQLGERIAEQAAHLDAASHRLLTDLREFDERGGWRAQGASSCAHWLAWRVGWDLVTARDHMRVARKLAGFPSIDDALRRGEVSYSKARAMLRVATPANERLLLDHARLMTASQLENTCRGYALVQRHGQDGGAAVDEHRRYVRRRDTEDGMVKIEAVLHPEEAELVWTMLTRAAAELADTATAAATAVTPLNCDSAESPTARPPSDTDGPRASTSPSPDLAPSPSRDSAESPSAMSTSDNLTYVGSLSAATSPSRDVAPSPVCDSAESPSAMSTPSSEVAPSPSGDSAESPAAMSRVVDTADWSAVEPTAVAPGSLERSPAGPSASRAAFDDRGRAPSPHVRIWRRCDSAESWESLSQQACSGSQQSSFTNDACGVPHRSLLDRLLDEADELRGATVHATATVAPAETAPTATVRSAEVGALHAGPATHGASIVDDSGMSARQASMASENGPRRRDHHEAIETRSATPARRGFNRVDALVSLAQGYLRGDRPNRAPIEVTLTIPKACLRASELGEEASDPLEAGTLGESFVSRETARRLSCDAGVVEVIEDEHGAPLSVGRKRRTIAGALKRALHKRDGACTFPGCTHRIFLEGHHIRHWADGGETSLNNALLLCSLHHRYVHEYGYTVELGPDRRPRFRDARGREVAAVPAPPPVASLGWPAIRAANASLSITAATIAGPWDGTPVDYARIVGHLAAVE